MRSLTARLSVPLPLHLQFLALIEVAFRDGYHKLRLEAQPAARLALQLYRGEGHERVRLNVGARTIELVKAEKKVSRALVTLMEVEAGLSRAAIDPAKVEVAQTSVTAFVQDWKQISRANKSFETAPSGVQTAPSGLQTAPSIVQTAPSGLQTAPSIVQTAPSGEAARQIPGVPGPSSAVLAHIDRTTEALPCNASGDKPSKVVVEQAADAMEEVAAVAEQTAAVLEKVTGFAEASSTSEVVYVSQPDGSVRPAQQDRSFCKNN